MNANVLISHKYALYNTDLFGNEFIFLVYNLRSHPNLVQGLTHKPYLSSQTKRLLQLRLLSFHSSPACLCNHSRLRTEPRALGSSRGSMIQATNAHLLFSE